jgi:hypothetical protein
MHEERSMRPLEAARRLYETGPLCKDHGEENDPIAGYQSAEDRRHCGVCQAIGEHEADCPWLAMPRIVAALEAAEGAIQASESIGDDPHPPGIVTLVPFGSWQALVAAMVGEP